MGFSTSKKKFRFDNDKEISFLILAFRILFKFKGLDFDSWDEWTDGQRLPGLSRGQDGSGFRRIELKLFPSVGH